MKDFNGKTVVITGAGNGIGRQLCILFAKAGANIVAADIRPDDLAETAGLLAPAVCRSYVLNVSDNEAVEKLAEKVAAQKDGADILINNAGMALGAVKIADMRLEELRTVMDVNFWGEVYCTKAFLPQLLARPEAAIVNMSSIYGITAVAGSAAYCASKFAVRGFSEALRQELRGGPVSLTVVHPGGVRTAIARNAQTPAIHKSGISREKAEKNFENSARTGPLQAAQLIVEAIRAKKPRLLVGSDAKLLDAIARLRPATYDSFMLKHVAEL
jgi:NADP-dependent 3-hydroxy acid dehydrogenase YdfG